MAAIDPAAPGTGVPVLTVAALVARIKSVIEGAFPSSVWVEGEIKDCTYHSSGHIYFTLADEKGTDRFGQRLLINCAFFKGANAGLKFKLTEGLKILTLAQVATYESRSQYQLRVLRVEPKGQGALQLAFEQLKARLSAEGLFDPARKRPIPVWPERVGVVTSSSGSAVHDMVSKLRGLFHVVILPVKVQGEGAAQEIAAALDYAGEHRMADVLIVGRGGGSVEDLWAFNEEPVARAIARCVIPVISAVGHQDDWTIADFVADLRASTPTDAAKMLVRGQETLIEQADALIQQLADDMGRRLEEQEQAVEGLVDRLRLLHPSHQLDAIERRAVQAQAQLSQWIRFALDRENRNLEGLAGRLEALSPLAVLARGYSITFGLPERGVVRSAGDVAKGQELETRLGQGRIFSTVLRVDPAGVAEERIRMDEDN